MNERRHESRRRWREVGPLVAFVCALAPLVGCSSLTGEKKKVADPILGEIHPQNTSPYAPKPPADKKESAPSDKTSWNPVPPPSPDMTPSPTSNAYLASITKPLPGSQTLSIGDGRAPNPFQLTGNAEPLVRPVPKDPSFVNGSWVAAPTAASANSSTPGAFSAQPSNFVDPQTALLKARGITQHRVDQLPDGTVRLIAIAPRPNDPSQLRTYDAIARDYPSAVQAVLQQIDQGK